MPLRYGRVLFNRLQLELVHKGGELLKRVKRRPLFYSGLDCAASEQLFDTPALWFSPVG